MQEHTRIRFLGALGQVTGSSTLLHHGGRYYLIDCGIQQGPGAGEGGLPIQASKIAAVFLTHAHMDHCGLLPWLVQNGFRGKVWCTQATAELAKISLSDSASQNDVGYSIADVERIQFCAVDHKVGFQFGDDIPVQENFTFSVFRTAHILGSVGYEFIIGKKSQQEMRTLVFTGDVGVNTDANIVQPLLNARQDPSTHASYIISESTYGDRNRNKVYSSLLNRQAALEEALINAAKRGDQPVVIIPCFALQRMQDVMADLFFVCNRLWKKPVPFDSVEVTCDSPLAKEYTGIYVAQLSKIRSNGKPLWLAKETHEWLSQSSCGFEKLLGLLVRHAGLGNYEYSTRKGVVLRVILAGSGMCNGGKVVKHLQEHLPNAKTTVFLTGYQAPQTPGSHLMAKARDKSQCQGILEWDLSAEQIQAEIVDLSPYYSGHADQNSLLEFLLKKTAKGRKYETVSRIFLNHGENAARQELRRKILKKQGKSGYRKVEAVECPRPGSGWFDLFENRWMDVFDPVIDDSQFQLAILQRRLERIEALLAKAGLGGQPDAVLPTIEGWKDVSRIDLLKCDETDPAVVADGPVGSKA